MQNSEKKDGNFNILNKTQSKNFFVEATLNNNSNTTDSSNDITASHNFLKSINFNTSNNGNLNDFNSFSSTLNNINNNNNNDSLLTNPLTSNNNISNHYETINHEEMMEKNFSFENLNTFVQKDDPDAAHIKLNAKRGYSDTNFQRSTHHYCGTSTKEFTNNYIRKTQWSASSNNDAAIDSSRNFVSNPASSQFLDQFTALCSRTRNTFVPPNLYPFRAKTDSDF